MADYSKIPISNQAEKEMHLTSSDRQWLKRALDIQDQNTEDFIKQTYDEHAKIICDVVKDLLKEQNEAFTRKFEEVTRAIKDIKSDIADIKKEIGGIKGNMRELEIEVALLKKYASLPSTILRTIIAITIGVALALGFGFLFFK